MDQVQNILKENWEKLLLGFAGVLFLLSVVWPFISPPETAKRSKAILDELNATVAKIQQSKPPKEEVPSYGEIVKKPYTESIQLPNPAKWSCYRKPFIWLEKYSGPQKVKKNPVLNEPVNFQITLSSEGVKLTWQHSKENEYCHIVKTEIYRKVGDGEFEKIATVPDDGTEYVDSNVGPKMTYSYYVRCYAKAEESDEVNPFASGKDQVESNTITIRTLPEAIVDISSFQLGETVSNYILQKVGKVSVWKKPPDNYKCPKGKEIKRITWNSNRQGQKPWARFIIWKLNQEDMKFEEYAQNFQY
ncbi:MAG: fibronectin type III domain-containing protein, partial [Planctomycetota bacterium]